MSHQRHHKAMRSSFICLVLAIGSFLSSYVNTSAADSVRVLSSFYRADSSVVAFKTSTFGDTVCIAYVEHIRTDDKGVSESQIQIRNWDAKTGATIETRNFFHKQLADQPRTFSLGNYLQQPHLVYCPEVNVFSLVNAITGEVFREWSVPDTIRSIYMSPDFSNTVVCTKDDRYSIYKMSQSKALLEDSVWRSYTYVTPPDTSVGLLDSSYFNAHFRIHCRPDSWSIDNSVVMLQLDRLSDTLGTNEHYRFETYWRPYDLSKGRYLFDSLDMDDLGRWHPDARQFCSFQGKQFFYVGLDSVKHTLTANDFITDYGLASNVQHVTLISPNSTISIWRLDSMILKKSFLAGELLGYAFNYNKTQLAYLTSDTVLHVMNIETQTGLFEFHLNFVADVSHMDPTAMSFLDGDRALLVRDTSGSFRILDLAVRKTVAVVDKSSVYATSPSGTSLFVLKDRISRYDLFNGLLVRQFPENDFLYRQKSIALSPDGKFLLSLDQSVQLWDVQTGALLRSARFANAERIVWSPLDTFVVLFHANGPTKWTTILNAFSLQPVYSFDSTLRWLNFSGDDHSHLVCNSEGLVYKYSISNRTLLDSIDTHRSISAATENQENTLYVFGDTLGALWKVDALSHLATPLFNAGTEIRKVVLSPGSRYLSFISADHNDLLRITDGSLIQALSTPTKETLFCQGDATCVCIYDDAIIRFSTSTGTAVQYRTGYRAYFRPQKNYFAVGTPDLRDSLGLFDFSTSRCVTNLRKFPTKSEIVWSFNSNTLATIDVFNNIVIWTPSKLKDGEVSTQIGVESLIDDNIQIQPQPVDAQLRIHDTKSRTMVSAQVVNALGQQCSFPSLSSGSFDTSSLPCGCYLIDIQWDSAEHSFQTFVVSR